MSPDCSARPLPGEVVVPKRIAKFIEESGLVV